MSTKTNIYYQTFYGRNNKLKQAILSFFYSISSPYRLLVEVFLRRRMGIRYYSLFFSICIVLFMLFAPLLIPFIKRQEVGIFMLEQWGWYLFTFAFGFFSYKRYKEVRVKHGEYDFEHFSLSAGFRLPFIENLKFRGKPLSVRVMNIYAEPLLTAAAALIFFLLGQVMIGILLLGCAIIYSLSYAAAFEIGRQIILDYVDDNICNRSLADVFMNDKPSESGLEFYGVKPTSEEVRKGVVPILTGSNIEEPEEVN